jgi:MFS family permease
MRGRFMGQLNFWGALAGLAGSFFVHQVLTDTARPWENRYALLFGVCSVLMFISYALFTANKEPLLPPPAATHRSMGEYLGALPALLRKDRGFTRFVIASVLASTNTVGQAFLLIFVLKDRALSDSAAGSFAISSALGSVCASLLLGWIGDRHGYKRVMMLSFLIYCLSMGLVMVTQGVVWAHVAFFGLMFNWVGTQMVSTNMVFEFAPPGKRPTYLGVANTLVAPALLLSSLAGGLLAPLHFGYQWALALSALCSLGGLVVMAGLKDPRKVNQGERV